MFLVFRHVDDVIDGLDRTGRDARAAVDTYVRIYVDAQCVDMETINGATRYTIREAARIAIFGHDMGHKYQSLMDEFD